ncbi:MAG: hypothetical protein AAGM22_27550 [Acidobacteriota bacterium]
MKHPDREIAEELARWLGEAKPTSTGDGQAHDSDTETPDLEIVLALRDGQLTPQAAASARESVLANAGLLEAIGDLDKLEELASLADVAEEGADAAWKHFNASLRPTRRTAVSATIAVDTGTPEGISTTVGTPVLAWVRRSIEESPFVAIAATVLLTFSLTSLLQAPKGPSLDAADFQLIALHATAPGSSRGPGDEVVESDELRLIADKEHTVLFVAPPATASLENPYPPVAEFRMRREAEILFVAEAPLLEDLQHYQITVPHRAELAGPVILELAEPSSGDVFGSANYRLYVGD